MKMKNIFQDDQNKLRFQVETDYCGFSQMLGLYLTKGKKYKFDDTDPEFTAICAWLENNDIEYDLEKVTGKRFTVSYELTHQTDIYDNLVLWYFFTFKTNEDAMHFKLSWC